MADTTTAAAPILTPLTITSGELKLDKGSLSGTDVFGYAAFMTMDGTTMLLANAGQTWITNDINKEVIMQVTAEMTDDASGKTTTFSCVAETEDFGSTEPEVDAYVTTGSLGTGGAQI